MRAIRIGYKYGIFQIRSDIVSGLSGEVRQFFSIFKTSNFFFTPTGHPSEFENNLELKYYTAAWRNINQSRIGGSLLSVLCIQLPLSREKKVDSLFDQFMGGEERRSQSHLLSLSS